MYGLRYRDELEEPTARELDGLVTKLKAFLLREHNEDGTHNFGLQGSGSTGHSGESSFGLTIESPTMDFIISQLLANETFTAGVASGNGYTTTIGVTVDGAGVAITTGVKGYIRVPFACTITAVHILADQAGDVVFDVWKDEYVDHPPTVADTITASAKPTLSSADQYEDTTLTGWTTAIAAGDVLGFNVDSAATVTRVTLMLTVDVAGGAAGAGGTGDVVGPASAVDDRIATYDGTTGKLIQDGGKTIAELQLGATALKFATLEISEAQLETMDTSTGFTLVSAPGSGKILVPVTFAVRLATSDNYTNAPQFQLKYNGTNTQVLGTCTGLDWTNVAPQTSYDTIACSASVHGGAGDSNTFENQPLMVFLSTALTGVGTAIAYVSVAYYEWEF
jgi:hypothetical protein